jgi:HTH-type transcriptional repressor of NAD biosynthesis genes
MQAASLVDKLYVVLSSSKARDEELCKADGCKCMPTVQRMAWLGWMLKEIKNIQVINIEDNSPGYELEDWEEGAKLITAAIPEHIDIVFSSEPSYEKLFNAFYPTSKHIVIDEGRSVVPISATEIRRDIYEKWEYLPPIVRKFFVKKVLITGTESCGKSTLTQKLAMRFNTFAVKEVGRDFCEYYSNNFTVKIFEEIVMRHQLQINEKSYKANKVLFVDSDAVVSAYYLKMYLNQKSPLIDQIAKQQMSEYDSIIFLKPDVKWVPDGFRFKSDQKERERLSEELADMYFKTGYPPGYHVVNGSYEQRYNQSCQIVRELFGGRI